MPLVRKIDIAILSGFDHTLRREHTDDQLK